jgi:hypothetical protein
MATKKGARPLKSDEDLIQQQPEDELIELDSGVTELLMQLGDTPSDAKVHLYRVRTGIRPPFAFLDEMTAGEFDIALVKERYGGGEFLVRVWQRGVAGFKINQRFSIEGQPRIADTAPPAAMQLPPITPGGQPIIVPQGDSGMAMAHMMRTMQEGFAQMAGAIQSSQRGGGIEETLRLVALVKQVIGAPSGNPLELMKDVIGIVREAQPLTGEGGKADGWSLLQSLAERVLPAIIERSAGAVPVHPEMIEGPTPMPSAVPVPPPIFTPTPPQPNPTEHKPMQSNNAPASIQQAFAFLAGQAASGADPATYAQLVLDSAEDATIAAFINRPDWFAQVCAVAPQAQMQREWWERLRALLHEALTNPPEDELPEAAEGSHYDAGMPTH